MVSVTRQPLRERTLCSSQLRSVDMALRSRSSGTTASASAAYSRSMEMPEKLIFITGTYASLTALSSVTSGICCSTEEEVQKSDNVYVLVSSK